MTKAEIQTVLDGTRERIDAISAAIDALKEDNRQLTATAQLACSTYLEDVKLREQKIAQRVEDLKTQASIIEQEITSRKPALMTATVKGDNAAFEKIQADLAECEARKAAITTQIEMLVCTKIPGDTELFNAAKTARDHLVADNGQLRETISCIYDELKLMIEMLKKLYDKTMYTSGGNVRKYSDVEKHFYGDDMSEGNITPREVVQEVRNLETGRYFVGPIDASGPDKAGKGNSSVPW